MQNKESPSQIKTAGQDRSTLWLLLILVASLALHLLSMIYSNLLVEEAYYWNYSQHLDWGYLDHPPMVSLLIKLSTSLLGTTEWSVRISALFCWFISAFFSYQWTTLLNKRAGIYAILLLAVLPFFFGQSLVITPDLPLIACWSASLYCLYRALVLQESSYWYLAGLSLGLGMLSKYTISLLGLATLYYLITVPTARYWFKRKEPYLAAGLVLLLFTPVIYWNANHEWASFLFQTKRRFAATASTDLHALLAWLLLFITPLGAWSLWQLLKKHSLNHPLAPLLPAEQKSFMRIFLLVPLGFFALFSLNHEINFNWIGPSFLALLPWIALSITQHPAKQKIWLSTAFFLLLVYSGFFLMAACHTSESLQKKLFIKAVAWETLIKNFHHLAQQLETKTQKPPLFVPLDNFPIGSELSFYQAKLLAQGQISKIYPVVGAHIFGEESLMYRYWTKEKNLVGKPLILVSKEPWRFEMPGLKQQIIETSELRSILSLGQGQGVNNIPFYYKIVQINPGNSPSTSS